MHAGPKPTRIAAVAKSILANPIPIQEAEPRFSRHACISEGNGVALALAALAGVLFVLGIGATVEVDWGWERQSLSAAAILSASASVLGTAIVFRLTAGSRRDRAAPDQLENGHEALGTRAQRAPIRNRAKAQKVAKAGSESGVASS